MDNNGVTPNEAITDDSLNIKYEGSDAHIDVDFNKLLLTRQEKSDVTEEMVKPISKSLYNATPYDPKDPAFKNGSPTKQLFNKHVKHLREGITHKPNQFVDGSTQLGFKRGYYPVVIWTDRGTINQAGTHWYQRWVSNMPSKEAFQAGTQRAKQIFDGKGK